MLFSNKWPYTNFHDLNLDWLIEALNEIQSEWADYQKINYIKYAGIWSIDKQYPTWSIVTDGAMAYISLQPTPAGIEITNGDYWLAMAEFGNLPYYVEDDEKIVFPLKATTSSLVTTASHEVINNELVINQ